MQPTLAFETDMRLKSLYYCDLYHKLVMVA